MIGQVISHYLVEEQLGAGGMGVVYRAKDTRLGRKVALKIIRPEAVNPSFAAAFFREAQLASSLNHPGIVTIYDLVQEGEQQGIVMEYLSGKPLNQMIPSGGFIPDRVLEIATQVAEALHAAHSAGVIHRDLKPGNVFVCDDGRVKVLDFGLARFSGRESADDTHSPSIFEGLMVGTLAYMAPEQARGERVDARADVFSLGVMMSLMLTGELPFRAPNPVALMRAMQDSEPTPIRSVRPSVPLELERLVLKALAKKPEDRFASMKEVVRELRGLERMVMDSAESLTLVAAATPALPSTTTPTSQMTRSSPPSTGTEKASIAVLPFTSASGNPDDTYLASGIASEVIRALTGVPAIRIAPQMAAFKLADSEQNPMMVGRSLNTRFIVSGSLRRSGERLRLTVELADCLEERVVWARNYDRMMTDIFEVQEDISRSVTSSLGGQLIRATTDTVFRVSTDNLDAWGLVRKAYHIWNYEFSPAGVQQALAMLRRALELDPHYAAAHAFLGFYLVQTVLHGVSPNPDADKAEAKEAAERAAELAPNDPEVLQCCVIIGLQTSQFEKAVQRGRRAVNIAPFDLVAWGYLALALATAGNEREVQEAHKILTKLIDDAPDHPSLPYWLQFLTSALIRLGRYSEAVDAGRRCVEMQPGYALQQMLLAEALYQNGELADARRVLDSIPAFNPFFTFDHYVRVLTDICRKPEIVEQYTQGLRILYSERK